MALVTVIDENGVERQQNTSDSSFTLFVDGDEYQPAVVTEIEVESNQTQAKTGTQCGTQKTVNTSTDPFMVTVTGIITDSDIGNELTAERLLFDVQEGDFLTFTSDLPNLGPMKVSNIVVRQEEDLVSVQTGLHDAPKTAFRFQLQFGEETNE